MANKIIYPQFDIFAAGLFLIRMFYSESVFAEKDGLASLWDFDDVQDKSVLDKVSRRKDTIT